jgi:hypothetical protein
MNEKRVDDGGPAYPCNYEHSDCTCEMHGMSLRDWFAGQALPSVYDEWAAHCRRINHDQEDSRFMTDPSELLEEIAEEAYDLADSMLKARNK